MNRVLLFSGGVDCIASYCLLDGKVDMFLYVHIAGRYSEAEYEAAMRVAYLMGEVDKLRMIPCPWLGKLEKENAELPYRNAFLIVVAKMYGNSVAISIESGTEKNESNDRSENFLQQASRMCSIMSGNPSYQTVLNPVSGLTKSDEVDVVLHYYGKERGQEILEAAFSCYTPAGSAECGTCPASSSE